MKTFTAFLTTLLLAHYGASGAEAKPLKVFILVGQSNMEGPATISTFDYIGDDPATAPMLKAMRGADGKPATCDGAWISYLTGDKNSVLSGKLTAGYGSMSGQDPSKPGDKIGPEFTFGLTMDAAFDEPVLIIKTAWGGKSLHNDFRPPSAGPEVFHDHIASLIKQRGGDEGLEAAKKADKEREGVYYRLMIEHVKKVLGDIGSVVPSYDPKQGYELSGFVWLQAWNDWCDTWWYPPAWGEKRFDEYGRLLAIFIRDVRKDLNAPKMPFVIGVAGFDGVKAADDMKLFRKAMAAPSLLPEFKGNVAAVETAPFWPEELAAIEEKRGKAMAISPEEAAKWKRGASNAGFHYYGCAKTFALMGKHFAEANLKMIQPLK